MPLHNYIAVKRINLQRKDFAKLLFLIICPFSSAIADNQLYDTALLPKWGRVVKDHYSQITLLSLRNIRAINNEINSYPYISDTDIYGMEEYWATPVEFYAHGGGDCEDYAIAKYFRLLDKAFPTKDMAVVVGTFKTNNTNHTSLRIVYEDKPLYLDNNSNKLIPEAEYLKVFTPIYYANDNFFGRNITMQVASTKFMPSGADIHNISTNHKE